MIKHFLVSTLLVNRKRVNMSCYCFKKVVFVYPFTDVGSISLPSVAKTNILSWLLLGASRGLQFEKEKIMQGN